MRNVALIAPLAAANAAIAGGLDPIPLPPPRPAIEQAAPVPLPIPRPPDLGIRAEPSASPPGTSRIVSTPRPATVETPAVTPGLPSPVAPDASTLDPFDAACTRLLASGKVAASRVEAVLGPGGCGVAFPIVLRAVFLPNRHMVAIEPPALLRCDLGEQIADWLRDDVAPLTPNAGDLLGVTDAAAYQCRGRNNRPGAQLSEHGHGDAIDVLGFRFSGHEVGLKEADAHPFWARLKTSACARFATVLGPGSDGYHETNLHLDLEDRRNGSRYCHWDDP